MYVFVNTLLEANRSIVFLDNFGIEWNMKLEAEIRELTFLGTHVTRTGIAKAGTSNFTYKTPLGIPMPTTSAPPHPGIQSMTMGPRISFIE